MDYTQYIRDAITSGRVLRISYADLNQAQKIVIIRPLKWEGSRRFSALVISTGEEWVYDVRGIYYCQSFSSIDQARDYEKRAGQGALQPPLAVPRHASTRPYRVQSNISSWLQPRFNRRHTIKAVTSGSEWNRLLTYYTKCIEQDWLRQVVIRPDQMFAFPLDGSLLGQFFKGKVDLGFAKNPHTPDVSAQFFTEFADRASFQLCLGYPFIFIGSDQAAPLVYTRLSMTQQEEQTILQSGKVEVNAAAARYLQVSAADIEALLGPGVSETPFDPVQLVDFVLRKLGSDASSILNQLTEAKGAKAVFQKPAMFWVDLDQAENGLLYSLRAMTSETFWQAAPELLKGLLAGVSETNQRGSPPKSGREFFPVTAVSDEIRSAVEAGLVEQLTLVIAPEDIHRSDLIMNITAHNFLAGYSVLIASRTPEMAGQILLQLNEDIGFQGAIGFGKWSVTNSIHPVRQGIETATRQTAANWGDELEKLLRSRHETLHADEIVEKIHSLNDLKSAYLQQRDGLAPSLIDPWLGLSRRILTHDGMPELQSEVTELITAAAEQNDRLIKCRRRIQQLVIDNEADSAVLEDLKAWEMQTGAAGSGNVLENIPSAIVPLKDYVQTWAWLVAINNIRYQQVETQQSLKAAREQILDVTPKLWTGLRQKIDPLAVKHSEIEMAELSNQFMQLAAQFQGLIDRKPGLPEQLSGVSVLLSPMVKAVKTFDQYIHILGLSWPPKNRREMADAAAYAQAAGQMSLLTRAVAYQHKIGRLDIQLKQLDAQSQAYHRNFSAEVQNRLENCSAVHFDNGVMIQTFDEVRTELSRLASEMVELINRIHDHLDENRLNLAVLTEFWNLDEPGLAGIHLKATQPDPQTVIEYLDAWSNLTRMLHLNSLTYEVDLQLAGLPSEAEAEKLKDEPPQKLVEMNRKILALSWLERTAGLDQGTIQNALGYLSAFEQPAELPFETEPAAASQVADAARVFPVWVGTERESRAALPIIPGLFDLVIVDGADQIHLAWALPLMVRAKRAVVIGSSVEFSGAAWMDQAEDLALAKDSGIDPKVFSFKHSSLLDQARRSLGKRAALIILDRAAAVLGQPSTNSQVLHPTNQLSLLACLDSSREFIWWIDPDFNNDLINLFWDRLQQDRMLLANEIRIITALEQVTSPENASQALRLTSLKALQAEMDDFGIDFEVRVLPKAGFPGIRLFFSQDQGFAMPSFPEAYRSRHLVTGFTLAEAGPALFAQYWDQAEPLTTPTI